MKTIILIQALLMSLAGAMGADTNTSRVISADVKDIKRPRSMVWQDCVGAGRVAEGLRAGWRQQLEECRSEIGFNYIRMHGLLQDELSVYSEDKQGKREHRARIIAKVQPSFG